MDDIYLKAECRDLFHRRCVMCGMKSLTVHEIIPRSNGSIALQLDNMVVLCAEHHQWAHDIGSRKSAPILREVRQRVLDAYSAGETR